MNDESRERVLQRNSLRRELKKYKVGIYQIPPVELSKEEEEE